MSARLATGPTGSGGSGPARGLALALAAAVLALAPAPEARAACVCGYQDGRFTLATITLDGNMGDWSSVLADTDNVSCDASGPTDRDFPVQSNGRDLTSFAVTWDSTYLYAHTSRAGSEANVNKFLYYGDVSNDGRMQTGEPVVYVRWQGSNRSIRVYFGTYVAVSPLGDSLADASGFADGYDMPGTLANLPPTGSPQEQGSWGSADGLAMEWRISWAQLGIPAGQAFKWHVSSTNSEPDSGSIASQIDDNMGGCGGCAASLQFGALSFAPNRSTSVVAGATAYLAHTLTNTGNGNDVFDLTSTWSGAFTPVRIDYYRDLGTVGSFDPGVDVLLTDTDGDSLPDTGSLAPGVSRNLLVAVQTPAGASGSAEVVTRATSSYVPACGSGTPASAAVTDTVTIRTGIAGVVYDDANHDGRRDGAETGTGLTLFAKLLLESNPAGPALAVAAVTPATGAYRFDGIAAGLYRILVDDNNTPSDVTPTVPSGWLGTEMPTHVRANVAFTGVELSNQDFGLFRGSRVRGVVFEDDGAGEGTSGDGIRNGAERGLPGVILTASQAACAGGVCDTTGSGGDGSFVLWIPAVVGAGSVTIRETNPPGYASSGGSPGTTGGSYVLVSDSVTFPNVVGSAYTGVAFADLAGNRFTTEGRQTALPGTSVFYSHSFFAGAAGQVSFSSADVASPALSGWAATPYRDLDCNAVLDPGEPQASGPFPLVAGGVLCLVVRVTVPTGAPVGAQDVLTVTASFTYAGVVPALVESHARTDVTIVESPARAGLVLSKSVDKATARPGDALTYTITYRNQSSAPLTAITVHDQTPAFTRFGSASCVPPLPPNLAGCSVGVAPAPGATGAIAWTLTGLLAPSGSGTVRFVVTID